MRNKILDLLQKLKIPLEMTAYNVTMSSYYLLPHLCTFIINFNKQIEVTRHQFSKRLLRLRTLAHEYNG